MHLKTKKNENVFLKSNLHVASTAFFLNEEEEIILKIKLVYISKFNSKREKNKLLIITDKKNTLRCCYKVIKLSVRAY